MLLDYVTVFAELSKFSYQEGMARNTSRKGHHHQADNSRNMLF